MTASTCNIDRIEVEKFDNLANEWWDPKGHAKPLHHLNPIRLAYIERHTALNKQSVLDIGCGAGLLSEAMAKQGAIVTGIDAAKRMIDAAKIHAQASKLDITYLCLHAEAFTEQGKQFDVITCMELLEHIPAPLSLLKAAYELLKPGGCLLLSTLNRTPLAYALGIVAAEKLLKLLPHGTHEYQKFIKPSELHAWLEQVGLTFVDVQGVQYNPITEKACFQQSVAVNYLACAQKPKSL